jgi:ribosomal subunit interface protein
MKIQISGKHVEIGDSLRQHVEDHVKALVDRQLGSALETNIVFGKDTFQFSTDLAVHISRHFVVRSRAEDTDPYRSFNLALEKMEARIHKYKARLRDRKRVAESEMFIPAQQYVIDTVKEDKGEDTPLIIAEMSSEIPTLSVGEAVMRMDLSESPVMMFRNPTNGQFNVVYRRNDGNVGWIDPTQTKDSH